MNFSCDNCQRRYAIADEKVRGKSVKIKCKNCGHIITVQAAYEPPEEEKTRAVSLEALEQLRATASAAPSANPWEDEATRAAPALDPSAQWFAMINGQQAGPFDAAGLTSSVGAGQITLETFLWSQGMAEWKRASEIPQLALLFAGGRSKPALAAARVPSAPPVAEAPRNVGAAQRQAQPAQVQQPRAPAAQVGSPRPTSSAPFDFDSEPTHVPAAHSAPVRETAPAPAPARRAATPAGGSDALGALFSDVELHQGERTQPGAPDESTQPATRGEAPDAAAKHDKDATLKIAKKKPGQRRFRPLRALFFVLVVLLLPVAVLYALTELEVLPPIQVQRVDPQGRAVAVNVFSREGLEGVRDQLWGKVTELTGGSWSAPIATVAREEAAKPAPSASAPAAPSRTQSVPGTGSGASAQTPAAGSAGIPGDPSTQQDAVDAPAEAAAAGIPSATLQKIVTDVQPAFKSCIDRERKVNPRFKSRKLNVVATVASSGVVRKATVDRRELDRTRVGECLKGKVKRLVFPEFSGDDVEVEIPLMVGGSM